MDNGVGAILVVNTPPEFNLWDNGKSYSNEELRMLITRILNDKDWLTYPTEDDFLDMVLEKVKIYNSKFLSYHNDDKILGQGLLALFESLYTGLMSKEIDNWRLLEVDEMNQSTTRLKVYF